MNLIIVESPTKARTLSRFLEKDYRVEASMGHIRDLPKAALGVDIEHNFTPKYVIPRDKQKRVNELKDKVRKADGIILATDPDREGEAIAWHIAQILEKWEDGSERLDKDVGRVKKRSKNQNISLQHPVSHLPRHIPSFQRIVFHEITEEAIKEALANPRTIDLKLVDAQQARRVLDRLVGYRLSPLLWQKLGRRWLSAGRVQSVAVRLTVEREREIEKFAKEEYWTVEGIFKGSTLQGKVEPYQEIRAQLVGRNGEKYEKTLTFQLFDGEYTTTSSTIRSHDQAQAIITDLTPPFTVLAVDRKEVKRYPPPPYTTSTLQQDAGRKLYFSSKKTMQLAQKLYEEGYITYHRTDSVHLAEKFLGEARAFIGQAYGREYVPSRPRQYQTKSKLAQEAHEAIRPTDVKVSSLQFKVSSEVNRDHSRLYELIWKRAVGSQAEAALFDATTIIISDSHGYQFEARGSVIKFDGFLKILGRDAEDVVLPEVKEGQEVKLAEATPTRHETAPPPRYTEATLVKTLEEKGIGRPSTYAPIISTIQERQYVEKIEKKLVPTDLGCAVTDFLVKYFPEIIDIPFTATMEDELDEIATGVREWVPVVEEFYRPFAADLDKTYKEAEKVRMPVETIDEACPQCGSPLVLRTGRYGKFVACSTFPKCDYTRQFAEKIDIPCPRCGGDIVVKKSRRGKQFYGCSNYPKCNFAAWKKEDIK